MKTFLVAFFAFTFGLAVSTLTLPMPWWPARVSLNSNMCYTADRVSIGMAALMWTGVIKPL